MQRWKIGFLPRKIGCKRASKILREFISFFRIQFRVSTIIPKTRYRKLLSVDCIQRGEIYIKENNQLFTTVTDSHPRYLKEFHASRYTFIPSNLVSSILYDSTWNVLLMLIMAAVRVDKFFFFFPSDELTLYTTIYFERNVERIFVSFCKKNRKYLIHVDKRLYLLFYIVENGLFEILFEWSII